MRRRAHVSLVNLLLMLDKDLFLFTLNLFRTQVRTRNTQQRVEPYTVSLFSIDRSFFLVFFLNKAHHTIRD